MGAGSEGDGEAGEEEDGADGSGGAHVLVGSIEKVGGRSRVPIQSWVRF